MSRTKIKQFITAASASVVLALGLAGGVAAAVQPGTDETHKVTICHGTNSVKNPYVQISVDNDAADGNTDNDKGQGDHSTHTGPIATSEAVAQSLKDNKQAWGDIIPQHDNYPGLNWPEGKAMLDNGCNFVTTGGSGGEQPGTTPTTNNGQVLGNNTSSQVTTTPVGSVAAGAGGVKELSPVAAVGLTGSIAVMVAGAVFAVKRFVRV